MEWGQEDKEGKGSSQGHLIQEFTSFLRRVLSASDFASFKTVTLEKEIEDEEGGGGGGGAKGAAATVAEEQQ